MASIGLATRLRRDVLRRRAPSKSDREQPSSVLASAPSLLAGWTSRESLRTTRSLARAVATRWVHVGPTWLAVISIATGASQALAQDSRPVTEEGADLFESYCSACHQYDDSGTGEAPPLDNSPWVTGPAERLIRIILHGVEGRIEIGGKIYNREMPGFGGILSDRQISALATYTRNRFGAGDAPVATTDVQRIREEHAGRKEYWPARELLEIR